MYGESDADPSNLRRALASAQLIALCTALKHVCSLKKIAQRAPVEYRKWALPFCPCHSACATFRARGGMRSRN